MRSQIRAELGSIKGPDSLRALLKWEVESAPSSNPAWSKVAYFKTSNTCHYYMLLNAGKQDEVYKNTTEAIIKEELEVILTNEEAGELFGEELEQKLDEADAESSDSTKWIWRICRL